MSKSEYPLRVLLSGGTGLIGRTLCRALVARGAEVRVYSRQPEMVPELCGETVQGLGAGDILPVSDVFINLAGEPILERRWSSRRKRVLTDSRVTLTERLVQRLSQQAKPPQLVLSGSAIGYYGASGDRPRNETAPPGEDFSAELCLAWERAAKKAESFGARVCHLRTGLVLSTDGGMLMHLLPSFRLGLGAEIGSARQWMSWIHLDDYIDALLFLLENERMSGAYNLTAPEPVTNREFCRTLADALGTKVRLSVPSGVLRLRLGEAAFLLLNGQRVLPERLQSAGFVFQYPELPAAIAALLAAYDDGTEERT